MNKEPEGKKKWWTLSPQAAGNVRKVVGLFLILAAVIVGVLVLRSLKGDTDDTPKTTLRTTADSLKWFQEQNDRLRDRNKKLETTVTTPCPVPTTTAPSSTTVSIDDETAAKIANQVAAKINRRSPHRSARTHRSYHLMTSYGPPPRF